MIKKLFSLLRGDSDTGKNVPPTPAPRKANNTGSELPKGKPAPVSNKPNTAAKSPEAICGIDPKKMDRDQIRKRLAELFRRHNQAEASLDAELRAEANVMLDAIVVCRQKYVDGV